MQTTEINGSFHNMKQTSSKHMGGNGHPTSFQGNEKSSLRFHLPSVRTALATGTLEDVGKR